jgi:hypothetical protein
MPARKPRLADDRTPPAPAPVTVTRDGAIATAWRTRAAAWAIALDAAGGDEDRLVADPDGGVRILNHPLPLGAAPPR